MLRETAQQLLQLLSGWDRRLRLQQSVVWVPRGLIGGLGVAIALAVAARLRPLLLQDQLVTAALIAGGAGIVAVLAVIWLARRDALRMARRFDSLFDLKERVSTSLEMATGRARSPNPEITERQLNDALSRARNINPAAYLPLRLVLRDVGLLAALIAVLALLILLDNPQSVALAQQQEIQSVIQNQVQNLEALREQIAENNTLDDQTREDLLEALDQAMEELSQQDISQEEALATLNDLAENIQQTTEGPQIDQTQQQAFEQAASQLQQQAEDLANALQQGDMQEAADALQQLGEQVQAMDAAQQQALSEALQQAADSLSQADQALSQALQQAADALEQGDEQAAQEALDQASQEMSQMQLAQQNDTGGQSPQVSQQQIVSQAAQQAEDAARQVAEAGTSPQQEGEPQQTGQGNPGDSAMPINQGSLADEEGQPGQSGQEGDGSPAQPGQEGQGAPGQQASSSSQTEQSAGGAGAGDSPSGGETASGFAGTGEQIDQNNNPDGQGLTDNTPSGEAQTIGGEGGPDVQLTGPRNPDGELVQEGIFSESPNGDAIIDYSQVFSDYANAANVALERDYIPLSLRDVVHDYFSSLEP